MCPFCISAVVSVAAGTVATAGVGALFAFAWKAPPKDPEPVKHDATAHASDSR